MALQLRRKTHESIIYIDRDSAPRIMPFGEDFILEDLPVGTRVIYPNPEVAVVVSISDWKKMNGKRLSLVEVLRTSPLVGENLDLTRPKDFPREFDFGE